MFYEVHFQSHNGAIAANDRSPYCGNRKPLSIPQWCDCCPPPVAVAYLLEVLSIPQWCDCCPEAPVCNLLGKQTFNPTMVRLLQNYGKMRGFAAIFFQSHNGAIAAPFSGKVCKHFTNFQSNNGAIAALWNTSTSSWKTTFNPTMVRLLPRQNFGI